VGCGAILWLLILILLACTSNVEVGGDLNQMDIPPTLAPTSLYSRGGAFTFEAVTVSRRRSGFDIVGQHRSPQEH